MSIYNFIICVSDDQEIDGNDYEWVFFLPVIHPI